VQDLVHDRHVSELVIHRQTSPQYEILDDCVYYPVNHNQMRDLLGRMLTHLDMMGLPDRAHRAARTLLTQEAWRWWDGVHTNAVTSYDGCIAPVVVRGGPGILDDGPASNRWGWESEAAYLASLLADAGGAALP
jgi:hypothetical protein